MIPTNVEIEKFLTRVRKEILIIATAKKRVPIKLKPLTECLAVQCFLNEHIYITSNEENRYISKLIDLANNNQADCDKYLAIIACYRAIYKTELKAELIKNYIKSGHNSKEPSKFITLNPSMNKKSKIR